jgi:hypothetical protein
MEVSAVTETLDTKNIGLRGIKIADTISDVDGEKESDLSGLQHLRPVSRSI